MSKPQDFKRQLADNLLRELCELSDRGQIVEGGWRAYELLSGLKDAPQIQRHECRKAFFLGAQHLFAAVTGMLDSGVEPTDQDLRRMTLLFEELEKFKKELK